MSNTRMMIIALTAAATMVQARAGILNDWQFNEASGTLWTATANAGSQGAAWNVDIENSATDGNGFFVIRSITNNFRDADITDVTNGTVYLRLDVASWDLSSGVETSGTVAVGFRDVLGINGTNDTALVRLFHKGEEDVELQTRVGNVNTGIANFREAYSNGLAVILAVNLDTDVFDVYYRTNGLPFVHAVTNRPVAAVGLNANLIRFSTANSIGEGSDNVKIDRLYQAESLQELVADYRILSASTVSTRGLQITSATGVVYELQYDDIAPPENWVSAGARRAGTGGTITLFDPVGYSTSRNYRVISK